MDGDLVLRREGGGFLAQQAVGHHAAAENHRLGRLAAGLHLRLRPAQFGEQNTDGCLLERRGDVGPFLHGEVGQIAGEG
ncbi:hypothetical protein D3C83_192240 [compost metagenome]